VEIRQAAGEVAGMPSEEQDRCFESFQPLSDWVRDFLGEPEFNWTIHFETFYIDCRS
jgi:hypothetical protein